MKLKILTGKSFTITSEYQEELDLMYLRTKKAIRRSKTDLIHLEKMAGKELEKLTMVHS